ncbi:hypothetical protein ACFFRR_003782 [Megaselia abdita]
MNKILFIAVVSFVFIGSSSGSSEISSAEIIDKPWNNCNRICDDNIIHQINALDIWTNCFVCFRNDCEFVKAQCISPGRKFHFSYFFLYNNL